MPLDESSVSFCDPKLRNADWSTQVPYAPGSVVRPFKVSEPTTGGNPAENSITLMAANPGGGSVGVAHVLTPDQYDPATDGSIIEISGSYDIRRSSQGSTAMGFALLLIQDGTVFVGPIDLAASTTWQHIQHAALHATDFVTTAGIVALHPDFSCGAKPIQVGFATVLTTPTKTEVAGAIDNWCMTMRTRCCTSESGSASRTRPPSSGDTSPITPPACCAETANTDADGNVVLPPDADPNTAPIYEDIDQVTGTVADLYPGLDTTVDTWYQSLPCESCIGGAVPPGAATPDIKAELSAQGVEGATPDEIVTTLNNLETDMANQAAAEGTTFAGVKPVAGPYHAPPAPHHGEGILGGRDLIFVHGLSLTQLKARLNVLSSDNAAAGTNWKPSTDPLHDASALNPEFYGNGYFKGIAEKYWEAHIQHFLTDAGKHNRYLIVDYNCNERLEVAAYAILRQIADAMKFGTGVVDPLHPSGPPPTNFGTPSFVLISHSTGGPVTAVALSAAANNSNLGVAYIPQHAKAHIAAHAAFAGSKLATAAIGGAVLTTHIWACPLARLAIAALGPNGSPPSCPIALNVVTHSVLVDLMPLVMQQKWGAFIRDCPVRSVTIAGAEPSLYRALKLLLHPGYDDGVVTVNSQLANPNSVLLWPSGFNPQMPFGQVKVFDMGVFSPPPRGLSSPIRAIGYYQNQVFDHVYSPGSLLAIPVPLDAGGAIPWLSPTGMLEPVGAVYSASGLGTDPSTGVVRSYHALNRSPKVYSFLLSASGHFKGSKGPWGPLDTDYEDSPNHERNLEETRVITDNAIYQPYQMVLPGDNQPLLRVANAPAVEERVRGRSVRIPTIRHFRIKWKRVWIWRRTYYLLTGWQNKMEFDYAYESLLKN